MDAVTAPPCAPIVPEAPAPDCGTSKTPPACRPPDAPPDVPSRARLVAASDGGVIPYVPTPRQPDSIGDPPVPQQNDDHSPSPEELRSCLCGRRAEFLEMLCRLGFHQDLAEDSVQDALVSALLWIKSGRISTITNLTSWLRCVAIRSGLKLLRCRFALSIHSEPMWCPVEEYDRLEEEQLHHNAIRTELQRLPVNLRIGFMYCKVDGHTLREAAQHFGLSLGTVVGRLARARETIRRSLGVDQPHDDSCVKKM
jgi:DNA-directed RNA polymerase specialized sigma24 family protein